MSGGQLSFDELMVQYRACDVVLSTATLEGGPMLVAEGAALGKPVVAPAGVGWVDSFDDDVTKYQCGDYADMISKL